MIKKNQAFIMNFETTKEKLLACASEILENDDFNGSVKKILLKNGSQCFALSFPDMKVKDITGDNSPEKSALVSSPFSSLIVSSPKFSMMCLEDECEIPAVIDDMAQIIGLKVAIVQNERFTIAKVVKKAGAVLTENGSLLTFGRTLDEALTALYITEKNAEIFVKSDVLGGAKPVNPVSGKLEHFVYMKKYSKISKDDENGKPKKLVEIPCDPEIEAQARILLADSGRKLLKENLVQGTWGNLSIRLGENVMLCTPSGISYTNLSPEDMVKVDINSLEYEGSLKPTSEKDLHAAIYKERSEVNAIIHAHSKYTCMYAATDTSIGLRDAKLAGKLGNIIRCSKYALSSTKALTRNVMRALGRNNAAILSHHGMFACGTDMDNAFDNALTLEKIAKTRINKRFEEFFE